MNKIQFRNLCRSVASEDRSREHGAQKPEHTWKYVRISNTGFARPAERRSLCGGSFEAHGRSMRWYEWVLMLLLLGLVAGVRAESVYKCTNAQGDIAYQAQPCAAAQQQTMLVIAPAPAHAAAPQYAVARRSERTASRSPRVAQPELARSEPRQATSYECRASDGEVFYRHGGCPRSIAAANGGHGKRGKGRAGDASVSVSAHAIPHDEACVQMHRAGAIGRAGREHDEEVSTYERNLGHDPCR